MSPLAITSSTVDAVLSDVVAWGARNVETGGFLLSNQVGAISGIALCSIAGVSRQPDQFVVSGRAMANLFAFADEQGYSVRAQFHSHAGKAFLSKTDLRHGFNVDGFITTVVPMYASPPPDPLCWRWWTHNGSWIPTAPPVVLAGDTRVVHFDENGANED